jgi:hypothetical protein
MPPQFFDCNFTQTHITSRGRLGAPPCS